MTTKTTTEEAAPQASSGGGGSALRFVASFLAVLLVLYTAYALTKRSAAFEVHREFLAWIASALLALPFDGLVRSGALITCPGQAGLEIGEGCDAIYAIMCFVSGVIAFPSTWKEKARGLLFGLVVIEVLNVVRIVSLFAVQRYAADAFHVVHTTVWEAVFVLAAVLMWSVWAARVADPAPARGTS